MITDRSKELLGMDEKFTCMISQQLQISSARTDFVHGSNMFCKIHLPGNCRHFFLFSCFTSEASRIASGAFRFRLKKFAFTDVKLQISPLVPEIVLNPWYIFLWMTKYWTTIWPSIKCRFRQFGSFLHCVEHGCCAGIMVHAFLHAYFCSDFPHQKFNSNFEESYDDLRDTGSDLPIHLRMINSCCRWMDYAVVVEIASWVTFYVKHERKVIIIPTAYAITLIFFAFALRWDLRMTSRC